MRKIFISFLPILACAGLFILASCTPDATEPTVNEDPTVNYDNLNHVTYTESKEAFANPERGFYSVASFRSASNQPLKKSVIETARFLKRTIFYMGFYLTDYMESDIAPEYLDMVRANFQVLREAGAKCVLRFAYSDSENEKPWDARPEIVQRHIENLKPVLQEYGDVIMCFQAGFVGVWGEWYYTNNFGMNSRTEESIKLRKAVVDAMLDALPKDRSVSLRTPEFKKLMYAGSYADTLTITTAHNQTALARLSCFNDCFGASSNDSGTFNGEDSREFWKKDSRYVFMGGETCKKSTYCECKNSLKDMEDYHWTYLNSEYNRSVISGWRTEKCYDEIERRLGYRLTLTDVYHTNETEAASGNEFRIALKLKNTGFSAPINPRGVELILIDGNGKRTVFNQTDVDPRFWFAGEDVTVDKTITLPADASGQCTIYLNLPDPKPTLHDNPMFSIRLANDNIWDETTGYNKVAEFTL